MFHVLNARITFGNIFASENPAEFVSCIRSGGSSETDPLCCVVEDRCFDVPTTYSVTGMTGLPHVRCHEMWNACDLTCGITNKCAVSSMTMTMTMKNV